MSHRESLCAGVRKVWREKGITPRNSLDADNLASAAVDEVIDALRYNPAWARSLGIGAEDRR